MEVNVLVVFYSLGGLTEQLATSVASGASTLPGVNVRMRRVADLGRPAAVDRLDAVRNSWEAMTRKYELPTHDDLLWADAIVLGCPSKFGAVASEMKAFLDTLGPLWMQDKLVTKAGAAFASSSSLHGGLEVTLQSLLTSMMHLGMLVVTPGYASPIMRRAGAPYGAAAVSYGTEFRSATLDDLAVAEFVGRRVTETAQYLKAGRLAMEPAAV